MIASIVRRDDTGKPLYWNNARGWSHVSSATFFTEEERQKVEYLPHCSKWEEITYPFAMSGFDDHFG
jgi:hypothetical protein